MADTNRRQTINTQNIPVNHQIDSHNRIFPCEIGEYKVDSVAGVGVYGIVLLAHLKSKPNSQFAIKGFFSPRNNDAEFATTFREIEIAKYISDHPNIVQPVAALSAMNMVQIPNGNGTYTIENTLPINFNGPYTYSHSPITVPSSLGNSVTIGSLNHSDDTTKEEGKDNNLYTSQTTSTQNSLMDLSIFDSKGTISDEDIEKFLMQNKKITTKEMILALKQMALKVETAETPSPSSDGKSQIVNSSELESQINETLKYATSQAVIQASVIESKNNSVFLWSDIVSEKRNQAIKLNQDVTTSQDNQQTSPDSIGSECSNQTEVASNQTACSNTQPVNLTSKITPLPLQPLSFMISNDEEAKEYLKDISSNDPAESQEQSIGFALPKNNISKPRFYFWHKSFGTRSNGIPSYQKISQFLVIEFLPKTLSVRLAEIVIEAIVIEGKTLGERVKDRYIQSAKNTMPPLNGSLNGMSEQVHYGYEKFFNQNGTVILNSEFQQQCTQEDYVCALAAANKHIAHSVLHILSELIAAVNHMHSKTPPVVHRDIKYDQIMFTHDNLLRLCDFGLARVVDKEINRETNYLRNAVKNRSRHPACLLGGSSGKLEIDVWAIGCLALQLAQFSIQACKAKLRANSISITAIHHAVTDPKNAVGTSSYLKILTIVSNILHKMLEETFPFEVQCSHLVQKWNSIFSDLFDTKGADDIYYAAAMFKFVGLPSTTEIRDFWAKLPLWPKLYERYLPVLQQMLDNRQFNDTVCKNNLKISYVMPLFSSLGAKTLSNAAEVFSKFFNLKAKYIQEKGPGSVWYGYDLSDIINEGGVEII